MRLLQAVVLGLVCSIVGWVGAVSAEEALPRVTDHAVCAPEGVAVGGYDVVSYHSASAPIPGSVAHAQEFEGLTYLFASGENLAQFAADPNRYVPKYRGWCSATLSMGNLACPDFTNFKIEHGQLLLFERIGFSNGLDVWNLDPEGSSERADGHYTRLLREAASSQDAP